MNFSSSGFKNTSFVQLNEGHLLSEPVHLFSNIEDSIIDEQISKLNESKLAIQENQAAETSNEWKAEDQKPSVSFDEFSKMDIRVGTIISAEKVKKADKLLKLEVDLGFEIRTVVSGIALHFKPEDLPGKQVCVLANLEPRMIKGIESKGMILMADHSDGSLRMISPTELTAAGSSVK
ncbi:MAG: methionine--tRNA ligase subunit beta [Bacteroidetes bacterium]|nr:methionine--tRNA ligase subunit beta [Bacteroidota bacterium]